jgi:hypothetical protein
MFQQESERKRMRVISIIIQKMVEYFDGDLRRINHAIKVFGFAKTIGEQEGLPAKQQMELELAAVLHDIGIKEAERKYRSCAGPYQEQEGPPVAERLLKEAGIAEELIERVSFLIGHHHSYAAIDGRDFQILVEADFLVNIDEEGLQPAAIASVGKQYFKTACGGELLKNLFLRNDICG